MDRPKILGQLASSGTAKAILYSLPVDNTGRAESSVVYTVVGSIAIISNDNNAATANVWIMRNVDTASTAAKELIAATMAIGASETIILNAGIILEGEPEYITSGTGTSAGIVVQAATGSLTFQAFGVEVLR